MKKTFSPSEFTELNAAYIREIHFTVKHLQQSIDKDKARLEENYCYYLSWCGEDLWRNEYKAAFFRGLLEELEGDYSERVFQNKIGLLKTYCSRSYNVRENSTGSLHREISTWRFMCDLEILETLEAYVKNSDK